jgi:hypothetical protein
LYEVAISIAGDTTGWFTWIGNSIVMNIAPYEYPDLYNDNSFDVHFRLKLCPDTMQTYSTKIQQPSNPFWAGVGIKERTCAGYTMGFMPWWSEMFCFPFDVEIKDVAADTVVWSATDLYWDDRDYVTSSLLKYGLNYSWISHDAKGLLLGSGNFNQTNNQGVDIKNEIRCDSATYTFSFPETTCFPVDVLVFWTYAYATPRDTILTLYNVTQSGYLPENTFTVSSTDYGWWRVEGVNNSLPSPFTAAGLVEPSSGRATSYNLYMPYNMNVCKPGYGLFRVSGNTFSPVDSIYFDIEGPPGYTSQSMAFDGGGQYWDFPETLLPAGEYTLTVRLTCGAPLISKYTIIEEQIFGRTELDYDSVWDCNGLTIFPKGRITCGGNDTTTYYRMVAYPSGLSFSDITPGGSFLLTKPGIYSMIMHYQGENCWGETIYKEINYQPQPLQLNPSLSSAYVCDGGGLGNITLAAQNGKPPYRYDLWDAAGTTFLNLWDEKTDYSPVYFNYGAVGDVFTVKFSDACGSQFSQQITLLDLATASISYALNLGNVCEDDEIQLYCMTLGITSYSWNGPGSWTSNEQNARRANATMALSGWYVVTVQPEHCGISKKDSVYITIHPKPVAPNVADTSLSYCKNVAAPSLLTASEAIALPLHTLKWYTFDSVVYTPIAPPNPIATSAVGSWDYYVCQVNDTTGCESNKVHITIIVLDLPEPPTVNPTDAICAGETFSITINPVSSDCRYRVYEAASGGLPFGQSAVGSGLISGLTAPASSTTYHVATVNSNDCESSRTAVNITVKNTVTSNPLLIVSDTTVCTAIIDLRTFVNNIAVNNVIAFYADSFGLTPLLLPLVTITSDTVYYVQSVDTLLGCQSSIQAIRITKGVDPIANPTTGPVAVCVGGSVVISNTTTEGGVWSLSNLSLAEITTATPNSVTVKGLAVGKLYVSYTVGALCKTRATFPLKVIVAGAPTIIIGF